MQGTCAFSEAKEENDGERGESVEHRQEVSKAVIQRLPRYYRNICELKAEGAQRISSRALAERMGLTASQIRQDFNCFGGFGQQGYGYNIEKLQEERSPKKESRSERSSDDIASSSPTSRKNSKNDRPSVGEQLQSFREKLSGVEPRVPTREKTHSEITK